MTDEELRIAEENAERNASLLLAEEEQTKTSASKKKKKKKKKKKGGEAVNDEEHVAPGEDAPNDVVSVTTNLSLVSLANVEGDFTERDQDLPESTVGGDTTCIVCFVGAKSHLAVPCGQCVSRGIEPVHDTPAAAIEPRLPLTPPRAVSACAKRARRR